MQIDIATPTVMWLIGIAAVVVVGFIHFLATRNSDRRFVGDSGAAGAARRRVADTISRCATVWLVGTGATVTFETLIKLLNGSYPLGDVDVTLRQSDF